MMNRDPLTLDEAIARFGPGILGYLKVVKTLPIGTGVRVVPPSVPDGLYSIAPMTDTATSVPIIVWTPPAAFVIATDTTIATYTCPAEKVAFIHELSMFSNKPSSALWTLTIAGKVHFAIKRIQTALTIPFTGNDGKGIRLNPGESVTIVCRSDGAVSVTADASILGVQEG